MLRRNVLIFHAGALGDFVLCWPLAMAMGRLYPQSRMICVCAGEKGKLFERVLRLESDGVECGWGALFAERASVSDRIGRSLAGAHTICSFVAGADSTWAANVRTLAPEATTIFIDPVLPAGFDRHAVDHLQDQLASHPVLATAMQQMRRSIADRGTGMPHNAGGPIVIHPGAGSSAKCWPLECFVELGESLKASGKSVQLIAGDVEAERWRPADRAGVRAVKTLPELLDVLRSAALFIGNDSGPAHLAGILGIPTIALFGPTAPANWRPLGPHVTAIARPALDQISVGDVLAAVLNGD